MNGFYCEFILSVPVLLGGHGQCIRIYTSSPVFDVWLTNENGKIHQAAMKLNCNAEISPIIVFMSPAPRRNDLHLAIHATLRRPSHALI